jgi:hypothetical protein
VISGLAPIQVSQAATLDEADAAIRALHEAGNSGVDTTKIEDGLLDDEVAAILEMAIQQVAAAEPRLVAQLRDDVLPLVYRAPIGELLRKSASAE